ncbi:hypothetical protein GPECTOR_25g371 [Gonium pectorale]|uniref:Glycosyl transferase CAP10 domain-containing protein n=1 Tax=Gonium pectorale TaxID=33097 RepID=A0A150GG15_GONPE|nr:hypothetical protein GPECTOR_25g371 [Gonium pectorale]|eukprot:KXZ48787.1 hypothetical protein GPECTOR_25g371 [Gonium pectorale]
MQVPGAKYFGLRMKHVAAPRDKSSCLDAAFEFEEPYGARYFPRDSIDGLLVGLPRAVWRWPGQLDKQRFDKAAAWKFTCTDCSEQMIHYKILGGRLYVSNSVRPPEFYRANVEEMLNVLLYLFPMPDMEFLVFIGDGCVAMPVLQWNVCFHHGHPGFTMPTYSAWARAMGRSQMAAYHSCLQQRYPAHRRKPLAVWRGANTNTFGKITEDNYMRAVRVQLHLLGRNHSDVLDARIYKLVPENTGDFIRGFLNDLGPQMPSEDYNRYCVIIDVDGNGWSDRFGTALIHYPTPVLKMASNYSAFFEHLYAPGVAIEQFSPDLSDLLGAVQHMVADCKRGGSRSYGQRLARTMQATSRALMDQIGVAEAMAYSLLTYKNLTSWPLDPSTEGFSEVDPSCCKHAKLPALFARAVSRRLIDGRVPAAAGALV